MPDELQIYQSDLTGPELDEALRNIGKVQQSVADAAQSAATAEQYGEIVQQNQQAIQEIHDNLTVIQSAPGNAQAAQTAATQAAASATQAAGSAADAAQSAEDAQAAAQQALGFRTFFNAISPDEDGSLDPSRPMTTASAKAAWTVRSEGSMLRSVEVFGYTSGGAGAGADGKVTVTVQGHTDSSVDIPLTQQLLAGESVQSYVDSGCDVKLRFNGGSSETWYRLATNNPSKFRWQIKPQSPLLPPGDSSTFSTIFCNAAPPNNSEASYKCIPSIGGYSRDDTKENSIVIYTDEFSEMSEEEFKSTLSSSPLYIVYKSTEYGYANDVSISLESHANGNIYAHDAIEITADPYTDADTGVEPGTYTVSSEDGTTVKVTLKALTENAKADTAVQPGDILDLVYPVGSIYMSCNATSPGALFGGTWERIEGSFLFAADDQHQAGSTGGSAAVTLTAQNIPQMTGQLGYCDGGFVPANGYARSVIKSGTGGGGTVLEGKTGSLSDRDPTGYYDSSLVRVGTSSPSSISILPPYLAVYIWRRTA